MLDDVLDALAAPARKNWNMLKSVAFTFCHRVRVDSFELVTIGGQPGYARATLHIDDRTYYPIRVHQELDTLLLHMTAFIESALGHKACADFGIQPEVLSYVIVTPLYRAARAIYGLG